MCIQRPSRAIISWHSKIPRNSPGTCNPSWIVSHHLRVRRPKMSDTTIKDRAAGAIMGAFIGDALGLGPHWYYDLAELRRDYGEWIKDYTDPQPDRYHAGLKAGQPSQAG